LGDIVPYRFNFDLSQLSQSFVRDIAKFSSRMNVHKKIGKIARSLVHRFKIHEITGLPISDALTIVEDLIDTYVKNISSREAFLQTKQRAIFLPHCSRKYMDSRCKAKFDADLSSYTCAHCSPDCLINRATMLGKKKGYDVYILPGGSCVRKILSKKPYEGIVGVACCEEIKMAKTFLDELNIHNQGIPLVKNGCSNTRFSILSLKEVL
jgi:hypothetical protein